MCNLQNIQKKITPLSTSDLQKGIDADKKTCLTLSANFLQNEGKTYSI